MTVTETTDQQNLASGLGRWLPGGGFTQHRPPARWVRLLFSAIWLVYLAQPLSSLHGERHSAWWVAAAVAVVVVFCVVFVAVVTCWDKYPKLSRWGYVLLFPLAAAVSVMFAGTEAGGNVAWIYVSSATGWAASGPREARRAVLAVCAGFLVFSWLGHNGLSDTLVTLIPVAFVGLAMSGIRMQIKLMGELAKAREAEAMLAANEERLRLARDMHDLTGQSLSVITLKSELAARLLRRLPEGPDRDRVEDEIQQVAAVSRQTLHDIREAISGYRRPTLAVEIITARSALESAGIEAHDDPGLTLVSGTVDPDAEAALAWCLREAVTNVIRHSGAKNCSVGLTRRDGELSLEVRDDGRGRPAGGPADTPGTGLHGMSERLCTVGGSLELRPDAPGFRLIATVPAGDSAAGAARDEAATGVTVTT
jgi:two-component system, NarL family, sensor histidine kinase DesK